MKLQVLKIAATIAVALSVGLLASEPGIAQSGAGSATDARAQQTSRPRTRLRVRPIYPYRHFHSVYPVPYRTEYPGPNAKRDCVAHYVEEHRPSGTVVTPRVNCRWVRG
jgi:hypothetical protein